MARVAGGPAEKITRSPPIIFRILTLQTGQTWAADPDPASAIAFAPLTYSASIVGQKAAF